MNLEEIKGIGPKTINLLSKLNIYYIYDLITYFPFRYNILSKTILDNTIDNPGLIVGTIECLPKVAYIRKNFNSLSFRLITENKIIKVIIYNRAFIKQHLKVGNNISLIGKYNNKTNTFVASDIKLKEINCLEIEPVYHSVAGINSKQINKIIINALDNRVDIEDYIPYEYIKEYNFISKLEAIKSLHMPKDANIIKQAKLRLIYEEFFIFMFKMNYLKYKRTQNDYGLERKVNYSDVEDFIKTLPFVLTKDQEKAIKEIYYDLTTPKRMNRLLLGDVGSGKTIVSIIALYINYLGGYQGSLMAPTEVLATQHYESITKLLPNLKIALLVGSQKQSEKKEIISLLKNNQIDILIGTHAILSDNVEFNNLGLVITDEQHRFGVNQRKTMQNKGLMTDVLYMSATPIPRTYALALYGDMDLSLIKTKPSGRKEIKTIVKKENEIKEVLQNIWNELKNGHQIYIVAPLIEDEEESNLNDIKKLKDKFDKAFASKVNIEILHGKMKKLDKNRVMEDYKNKKIQILISTTVIEVGIDVKNATVMVIYNAERFGLATLHQLRGRVGRNELTSYCYLICNQDIERLKVLEESNDGFYISEKDFEMRGEGDLFGIKQSGDMAFKLGDLRRDYKILMKAKEDSENYLNNFDNNILFKNIMDSLDINN
ncbi:MAG: ATP-dependent DNA helicase RecG [Bacilli bacterium]|nr:ATP-dependent DNA helicase RecG [Bacilli bacterium]